MDDHGSLACPLEPYRLGLPVFLSKINAPGQIGPSSPTATGRSLISPSPASHNGMLHDTGVQYASNVGFGDIS